MFCLSSEVDVEQTAILLELEELELGVLQLLASSTSCSLSQAFAAREPSSL